jgi:hypothetical protein
MNIFLRVDKDRRKVILRLGLNLLSTADIVPEQKLLSQKPQDADDEIHEIQADTSYDYCNQYPAYAISIAVRVATLS